MQPQKKYIKDTLTCRIETVVHHEVEMTTNNNMSTYNAGELQICSDHDDEVQHIPAWQTTTQQTQNHDISYAIRPTC